MTLSDRHRGERSSDNPSTPGVTADATDVQGWMRRQLFEQRVVLLSGDLDDLVASAVGVALMTLDASGDDPVQLQIDSGDGTIGAALALMDIIDLLGVPVRAICIGQAAGAAVGVLAVCHHRTVTAHARLRLIEPRMEAQGSARQLEQLAAAHMDQWTMYCDRLSEVTGQTGERILEDASRGRFLSADEAVAYGLVDEIATSDARIYRLPGRSIGFGPW
jgi:ATP-dependent Clp protease, protease subunit